MFRLLCPGNSMIRYTLHAWVWTTVPTFAIAILGTAALHAVGISVVQQNAEIAGQLYAKGVVAAFFLAVVCSPLAETLLMAPILRILGWMSSKLFIQAIASAFVWGILHSSGGIPVWGLFIFWPFFVFSVAFLVWKRKSWWRAFAVVAALHALHNASVLSIALL